MHRKLEKALAIIRKFHGPVNPKATENDSMIYLYGLTVSSVGNPAIEKAVIKAEKQQDYPEGVFYKQGLLAYIEGVNETVEKEVIEPIVIEAVEAAEPIAEVETEEETTEESAPKVKKSRKKKD